MIYNNQRFHKTFRTLKTREHVWFANKFGFLAKINKKCTLLSDIPPREVLTPTGFVMTDVFFLRYLYRWPDKQAESTLGDMKTDKVHQKVNQMKRTTIIQL